jgi:NADH-quinone oxidoreductase subunit H
MIQQFIYMLGLLLGYIVLAVYAERKIAAAIQDRLGPMETGKYGYLQTIADLLKLLQKEHIQPLGVQTILFYTAPVILFLSVLLGFAFVPVAAVGWSANAETGIFFLLAILSLDVLGILAAGWSSNNKYSLYGAVRGIAQLLSYEIPMGLSVLCVVVCVQTLNLEEIVLQQGIFAQRPIHYLGSEKIAWQLNHLGGIFSWNIISQPILVPVFVIFFIASLAEANRPPFDLPEAESEIIAGFHTEYSGYRWAIMMLAEYGIMLLMSLLAVTLFFGGWNTPFFNISSYLPLADWTSGEKGTWSAVVWGSGWLLSKTFLLIAVKMWLRWSYPRLRIDQLMTLCWKYLTPLALCCLLLCSIWKVVL